MSLYLEGLVPLQIYWKPCRSSGSAGVTKPDLTLYNLLWSPQFHQPLASITAKSAETSIPSFVLSLDFSRAPFAALRNTAPAGRPRTVLSVVGVGGAKVSTMRCKVSLSWRNSEGLEFKWGSLEWTKLRCTYQTLLITKKILDVAIIGNIFHHFSLRIKLNIGIQHIGLIPGFLFGTGVSLAKESSKARALGATSGFWMSTPWAVMLAVPLLVAVKGPCSQYLQPWQVFSMIRGIKWYEFIQEVIHPGAPWTWHNIPHPVNL